MQVEINQKKKKKKGIFLKALVSCKVIRKSEAKI